MRLARFLVSNRLTVGFYDDKFVVPLAAAAEAYSHATHDKVELPSSENLLDFLPPAGQRFAIAKKVADWAARNDGGVAAAARLPLEKVELLRPIERPNKLLLLAGNYNEHITEGGGRATERAETFPYVFMKPPTTALVDPFKPVVIPKVSPDHIDYQATITDPQTFSEPWTIRMPLYRMIEDNAQLLEFKCVPFAEELLYKDLELPEASAQ